MSHLHFGWRSYVRAVVPSIHIYGSGRGGVSRQTARSRNVFMVRRGAGKLLLKHMHYAIFVCEMRLRKNSFNRSRLVMQTLLDASCASVAFAATTSAVMERDC